MQPSRVRAASITAAPIATKSDTAYALAKHLVRHRDRPQPTEHLPTSVATATELAKSDVTDALYRAGPRPAKLTNAQPTASASVALATKSDVTDALS